MSVPKLLVVGGNGFLGSTICRMAALKGWHVTSMSSSGKPFTSPAGHTPAWVSKVNWVAADAFEPFSYTSLISSSTAVVHTLGILLEDTGYKKAVREGNPFSLIKSFSNALYGGSNPLKTGMERKRGYEGMNRDSALTVLNTLISTPSPTAPTDGRTNEKTFVYISAADAFRPLVPRRYIESKREAELEIARRCSETQSVRPLFIRPGLMYHPHLRPLSTLPAFLINLSAKASAASGIPNIFPKGTALHGAAEALKTYPLHVDHVADAVLRCIEGDQRGVVGVEEMRRWSGFVRGKEHDVELQG
ncbi:uncharacterized protein L203_102547 [Cryptococcus depauperatus CBS 7841]|uniref:Uncharacterized protein n=1 Tax=Cryptococcus depauperatus CBS 7841 TaxID=1295531 RepID=A0A1E3IG03_9TREE|nr:mitochondrial protein [Cryptococcus depauperatus CBS 7841]